MVSDSQPRFADAEDALKKSDALLKHSSHAQAALRELARLVCEKRRRLVLFLGAGCSKQVTVITRPGEPPFFGLSWEQLIQKLLETLPDRRRAELLENLHERLMLNPEKVIGDDLDVADLKIDRLLLAWFIGKEFGSERDQELSSIVEPPNLKSSHDCRSELHDQLLSLPFDDIVTTNYDHHIERFLQRRNSPIDFVSITNCNQPEMTEPLRGALPRLFYLHGRAHDEATRLIFDRFDYAKLMAERDGILDYITYMLRDAHVVYVGFGLDDPTFNFLHTKLEGLHGVHLPRSYAFIPQVTDRERDDWHIRRLSIIDYGPDFSNLPKILSAVNIFRSYLQWAEPTRPQNSDPTVDRTTGYMAAGLKAYVEGAFVSSLLAYRAALATTILWNDRVVRGGEFQTRLRKEEKAAIRAEIRIRLALNYYKLSWSPDCLREIRMEPLVGLAYNIDRSQKEIEDGMVQSQGVDNALFSLKQSLNVLRARKSYREGDFKEAQRIYQGVVTKPVGELLKRTLPLDFGRAVSRLRLAEAYFYSKCQISRIDYQFLPDDDEGRLAERKKQLSSLRKLDEWLQRIEKQVQSRLREMREREASSERNRALAEYEYFAHCIATIRCIALWTAGRHAVRVCKDVLPTESERVAKSLELLDEGVRFLETDPLEFDSSQSDADNRRPISSRWRAQRGRYLARAYGLKWLIQGASKGEGDLIEAYRAIQDAIAEASGQGLERQRILNLLEAARLNLFAIFGQRLSLGGVSNAGSVSPLSQAAGIYYLDCAFAELAKVTDKGDTSWLRALGLRLASYFAIVSDRPPRQLAKIASHQELKKLFNLGDAGPMSRCVSAAYRDFAAAMKVRLRLNRRISYYEESFSRIKSELSQLKRTKPKTVRAHP